MKRGKEVLPRIHVPSKFIYGKIFTGRDANYGATVIVESTGILGIGMPIYRGPALDISDIEPPLKIKTIIEPTEMWYTEGDGPADGFVNGCLVEEVLVVPTKPVAEETPIELP